MTTITDIEPAVIATVMRTYQSINMRNSNKLMSESLSRQGLRKELRDKILAMALAMVGEAEPQFSLIINKLENGTSFEDVVLEQANFSSIFSAKLSGRINDMIQKDIIQNPECHQKNTLNSISGS